MSSNIVVAEKLTKKYSEAFCLGPITLSLEVGKTIALLGQNGAGKSTLFQLLSGNLDRTDGELLVSGQKMMPEKYELKRAIGYLRQNLGLPRWATGRELLNYVASLHALADQTKVVETAMDYWDCRDYQNIPMAACSHGMQKRIGLAVATMHNPALLILDEPFSGLDLFHIRALFREIVRRQDAGLTTILSTHIAPYAAKLCHRALVLSRGQLSELNHWTDADEAARIGLIEHEFFASKG